MNAKDLKGKVDFMGVEAMNFGLTTHWEPDEGALKWTKKLLSAMSQGASWVGDFGTVTVHPDDRSVVVIEANDKNQFEDLARIRKAILGIGWKFRTPTLNAARLKTFEMQMNLLKDDIMKHTKKHGKVVVVYSTVSKMYLVNHNKKLMVIDHLEGNGMSTKDIEDNHNNFMEAMTDSGYQFCSAK